MLVMSHSSSRRLSLADIESKILIDSGDATGAKSRSGSKSIFLAVNLHEAYIFL